MNKLNHFLTGIIFLMGSNYIFAQPHEGKEERRDQFKAKKIGFITEKLSLTSQEAQVFWPVYNEYDAKREAIGKEKMEAGKHYKDNEATISDKEAEEIADRFINLEKQESQLSEDYYKKFKTVLPIKKVLALYEAELQFRRHILQEMKKGEGHNHRPGPGDRE
jgi:hypothetical protein